VLWAWGARGGYAGPAAGIFAQRAGAFSAQGLTSLRLHYRHPGVYVESVLDVRAGLAFLQGVSSEYMYMPCMRYTRLSHVPDYAK